MNPNDLFDDDDSFTGFDWFCIGAVIVLLIVFIAGVLSHIK